MNTYRVTFEAQTFVEVEVNGHDQYHAEDVAHEVAGFYLEGIGTKRGDSRITDVRVTLEGVGADRVEKVS